MDAKNVEPGRSDHEGSFLRGSPWSPAEVDECLRRLRFRQRTTIFAFARKRLGEGAALKEIAAACGYKESNARRLNTMMLHVVGCESTSKAITLFHRELLRVCVEAGRALPRSQRDAAGRRRRSRGRRATGMEEGTAPRSTTFSATFARAAPDRDWAQRLAQE